MSTAVVDTSELSLLDLLPIVDRELNRVARRLPAWIDRDDLASAGREALVRAHSRAMGSPDEVRSFCATRVCGAMLDELRRLDPLPRRHRDLRRLLRRSAGDLEQVLGRVPTDSELASASGVSLATIREVADIVRATSFGDERDLVHVAEDAPSPADLAGRADLRSRLLDLLAVIPSRERTVLVGYYLDDLSLDDLSTKTGESTQRICQLRNSGLKRLREQMVLLRLWQALVDNRHA